MAVPFLVVALLAQWDSLLCAEGCAEGKGRLVPRAVDSTNASTVGIKNFKDRSVLLGESPALMDTF